MKTVQLPNSPTQTIGRAPLYIVDPETASVDSVSLWDDERGIMALRKYYALRDEAQDTVTESKQVWHDTPFSIFAVQCEY
jgi:serine/arginine repetitive matrix protein 2